MWGQQRPYQPSQCHAIRDVVFNAAQSAALGPSKETPGLVPDSASRPADVLLPNWINGRPAALDIHVISSLQSLTLSEAARIQGHALPVGVQRKLASNLLSCRSVGLTCILLVAETLGGLAEDFVSTIQDIGRSIYLHSGADRDIVTKHLFGRVSIALWRGNATMLIHRSPTLSPVLDGHTLTLLLVCTNFTHINFVSKLLRFTNSCFMYNSLLDRLYLLYPLIWP